MKINILIAVGLAGLLPAVATAQSAPAATTNYESNADTAWRNTKVNTIIRGKVTNNPKVDPRGWQPIAPPTPTPTFVAPKANPESGPDVTRAPGPIVKRRR
jgi:hypothetical protein